MANISAEWFRDDFNKPILLLRKPRGKFNLEEIEEFLRYENRGNYQGHYAILLNASEQSCGGSGWMDEVETKGDTVALHELGDGEECPICCAVLTVDICPHCGEYLREK